MENKDKKNKKIRKQYEELFTYGLGTVGGVFLLIDGYSKFQSLFESINKGVNTWNAILPFLLFIFTIGVGLAWFISGKSEMEILEKYFGEYAPERPFGALPLIIIVATTVALLAFYSDKILIYAFIYWIFVFLGVYANWLKCQHVLNASIHKKKNIQLSENYHNEVELFYTKRPSGILGYWIGTFASLALSFAIFSRFIATVKISEAFQIVSYALIMISILINELIIWKWRFRLYQKIRDENY